jgi:hypothetical protein
MRKCLLAGLVLVPLAARAQQSLPNRAPGLWRSITTVIGADGQPLPNASNVITVSCVDPANDQRFFMSEESHCSALSVSGGGHDYAIDGTCDQRGKTVHIAETLGYASDQAVTLHAQMSLPSGPISVSSSLAWQGPCLAGMQPGDDAALVAGAFSKADNINDPDNR